MATHEAKGHESKGREAKEHGAKHGPTGHAEPKKGEVADEVHEVTMARRGDLTKLAGSKAEKTISHWQARREAIGGVGLKAIATDLGKLKELVADESPGGAEIGKGLNGLGDKVAKLAEEQGGVVDTAPRSLAGMLHKGGTS